MEAGAYALRIRQLEDIAAEIAAGTSSPINTLPPALEGDCEPQRPVSSCSWSPACMRCASASRRILLHVLVVPSRRGCLLLVAVSGAGRCGFPCAQAVAHVCRRKSEPGPLHVPKALDCLGCQGGPAAQMRVQGGSRQQRTRSPSRAPWSSPRRTPPWCGTRRSARGFMV